MDAINYLSLASALNYNNSIQGLYNYNPYSASNLYGSSDSSNSFGDIFGSCINALQTSNTTLLSNLASSTSNTSIKQLTENLEEASKETCDCKSADLVKELYSNYLSNTLGYTKNNLTSVTKNTANTSQKETVLDQNTISSIPSEEEIESMINASLSLPV